MPGFPGLSRAAPLEVVIDFANRLMQGRLNAYQDVTLAANAASTVILDPRLGATSWLVPMALTANAAAEPTLWYSSQVKGAVTVNHADNTQTDRSFRFLIIG